MFYELFIFKWSHNTSVFIVILNIINWILLTFIGKCFCKLTKEIIVQHYTSIEKDLHSLDKMLKTFGTFEGFDDTTKGIFKQMYQSLSENKVEAFLRTLLDLSDSGVHLCLLEREMRTTNPELLKRITSNPLMEKGYCIN